MGMFDDIVVHLPLPGDPPDGLELQTKDTPAQQLDKYEIRADGTLWHEAYDIEDRSDPNAKGLAAFIGCLSRVNTRWVPVSDFTGEIRFYDMADDVWWEWSAYLVRGRVKELHLVSPALTPKE